MAEQFDDLRSLLRDEGIASSAVVDDALADPHLADAADRALAGVLARDRARHRRHRIGGALAVAVSAAAIAGAVGGWPRSPSGEADEVIVSPLVHAPSTAAPGAILDGLARAAASESAYGAAAPRLRTWYRWESSSPAGGRVVVVAAQGDGEVRVESFDKPAPDGSGGVDVSSAGPPDSVTLLRIPTPAYGSATLDALVDAAGPDCTLGRSGCALQGLAALRVSPVPRSVVSDAAAWAALATLPGVLSAGPTTDRLGRPGIAVESVADAAGRTVVAIADPDSGAFLGAEWVDGDDPPTVDRLVVVGAP